ncbi:LAGLIDADG family homing endonuclease [Nocardia sp. NPDC050717]|uniref:LAGLIDADG family homing endonuclease n=1 Tax=Nocardia sp. NPDC050717 TaxID=3157221 RepID=UPI0033D7CE9A
MKELIGIPFAALVDGKPYASLSPGFFRTGARDIVKLRTSEGYEVRLTADQQVLTYLPKSSRYATDDQDEWRPAGDLKPSTHVYLTDNLAASWGGRGTDGQGYVLGNLVGDGTFYVNGVRGYGAVAYWDTDSGFEPVRDYLHEQVTKLGTRADFRGWSPVTNSNQYRLKTAGIRDLAADFDITAGHKTVTPVVEHASSDFYRGFLRALFDADGHIEGASTAGGVSIRLTSVDVPALHAVQRMLARLGIRSSIRNLKDERVHDWGDRGGKYLSRRSYRLIITGANAERYMQAIGFLNTAKAAKWVALTSDMRRGFYRKPYTATVASVEPDGHEAVYAVTVADVHSFEGNGILLRSCGGIMVTGHTE